jgi:hypothetical protein
MQTTTSIAEVATTTTTIPPTTTIEPLRPADGMLNGTYAASLDNFIGAFADTAGPLERTFVFTADCSQEPCHITGEIELANGTREVAVSTVDGTYTWELDNTEVAEQGGAVICEWDHKLVYEVSVEESADIGGLWTAIAATGQFTDTAAIRFQAEGVNCEVGAGGGDVSLGREE